MRYRPNADSLAGRMVGFFALHPDEELSLDDVIVKFIPADDSRNVHRQLSDACDHDYLRYDAGTQLYTAGTVRMPSLLAPDAPAPTSARRPGNRTRMKEVSNEYKVDGPGKAAAVPAVPNHTYRGYSSPCRQGGEIDLPDGGRIGLDEGKNQQPVATQECPANRIGTDGPRPVDPQGDEHGQSQGGLEAGGSIGVGSEERAGTGGTDADGGGRAPAPESGQPAAVHEVGTLAPGEKHVSAGADGVNELGGFHQETGDGNGGGGPASGIASVRQHLLDTLRDLRNPDAPMALDRAKVVAEVAAVLVNSAKVEVDYLKVTQQRRGAFFETPIKNLVQPNQ